MTNSMLSFSSSLSIESHNEDVQVGPYTVITKTGHGNSGHRHKFIETRVKVDSVCAVARLEEDYDVESLRKGITVLVDDIPHLIRKSKFSLLLRNRYIEIRSTERSWSIQGKAFGMQGKDNQTEKILYQVGVVKHEIASDLTAGDAALISLLDAVNIPEDLSVFRRI